MATEQPFYRVDYRRDFGIGPMPWQHSVIGWRDLESADVEARNQQAADPKLDIRIVRVTVEEVKVYPPVGTYGGR